MTHFGLTHQKTQPNKSLNTEDLSHKTSLKADGPEAHGSPVEGQKVCL